MREKSILSVTQLNDYLKMLLDGDRVLSDVWVRGEVSNCTVPRSGHLYLTLKDEEGQLRAVMFRTYSARLLFCPEDGMRVLAHGRISLYGPSGQYQLYIDDMQPDGAGSLAMRYEQLRRRLEAEGLFDAARKKPLPEMPMRIGVITSPTGAAVQDIRNILGRRFPCAEMILFPAAVQGAEAPAQLCMGIEFLGMTGLCDVIIIGRGGGSAEDLWAFNDERLARTVAACPIPVVSAVGHESDFTICDFVSDCRAPTPSAAAELVVPDCTELLARLSLLQNRLSHFVRAGIANEKRYLNQLAQLAVLQQPDRVLDAFRLAAARQEERLTRAMDKRLERYANGVAALCNRLEAMSPLSVLSRGYAAVSVSGRSVMRAKEIQAGERIKIQFTDGAVYATAEEGKVEEHYAEENPDI